MARNPLLSQKLGNGIWVKLGADNIWEARRFIDSADGDPFSCNIQANYFHGRAITEEKAVEILNREAALFADMNKTLGL